MIISFSSIYIISHVRPSVRLHQLFHIVFPLHSILNTVVLLNGATRRVQRGSDQDADGCRHDEHYEERDREPVAKGSLPAHECCSNCIGHWYFVDYDRDSQHDDLAYLCEDSDGDAFDQGMHCQGYAKCIQGFEIIGLRILIR